MWVMLIFIHFLKFFLSYQVTNSYGIIILLYFILNNIKIKSIVLFYKPFATMSRMGYINDTLLIAHKPCDLPLASYLIHTRSISVYCRCYSLNFMVIGSICHSIALKILAWNFPGPWIATICAAFIFFNFIK